MLRQRPLAAEKKKKKIGRTLMTKSNTRIFSYSSGGQKS